MWPSDKEILDNSQCSATKPIATCWKHLARRPMAIPLLRQWSCNCAQHTALQFPHCTPHTTLHNLMDALGLRTGKSLFRRPGKIICNPRQGNASWPQVIIKRAEMVCILWSTPPPAHHVNLDHVNSVEWTPCYNLSQATLGLLFQDHQKYFWSSLCNNHKR